MVNSLETRFSISGNGCWRGGMEWRGEGEGEGGGGERSGLRGPVKEKEMFCCFRSLSFSLNSGEFFSRCSQKITRK